MVDRMTKALLTVIALLLLGLLMRPLLMPTPAQAQAASRPAMQEQPQLVVNGPNVWVIYNGKLCLYDVGVVTGPGKSVKTQFKLEASTDLNAAP